jgi:hypothetical protein
MRSAVGGRGLEPRFPGPKPGVLACWTTPQGSTKCRIYQRRGPARRGNAVRRRCEHMFVPRYSEDEARQAIQSSFSYAEAVRKLGLRPSGGNHELFRRYVDVIWKIDTDHFEPGRARRVSRRRERIPLEETLVAGSTYPRKHLKRRLFESGLKPQQCELCGQGEVWRGRRMGLILDHINGVPDDNRLENLRIACPNCAATFDTHCGRTNRAHWSLGSARTVGDHSRRVSPSSGTAAGTAERAAPAVATHDRNCGRSSARPTSR